MSEQNDLLYSKDHEWIKIEGSDIRIGITEHAQDELGDIVFVDLPEKGDTVEVNESFGSVESVKTISELYSPINGTIVEVTEELEDNPEFVNESPYEKGWMIVVTPSDDKQLDNLLSYDEYQAYIES